MGDNSSELAKAEVKYYVPTINNMDYGYKTTFNNNSFILWQSVLLVK